MRRKVIKQGNGTLTMTLPKKWTKEMGLSGESELDVEESGNELVVNYGKPRKGSRIEIQLESNNLIYVKQVIRNLYLAGYDEIYVKFFDKKSINRLNHAVDELIGYHIIEQSSKGCLIKNLSSVINEEFSVLLRKVFLLNKSLLEMLLQDLKNNDLDKLDQVRGVTKNIHQFGDYCRRMLAKKHIFNSFKSTRIYILIVRLISCANTIEYIYEQMSHKKNLRISKDCISFVKQTYDFYVLFYNIFYEKKLKDIPKLSTTKGELLNKRLPALISKKNPDNLVILSAAQIIKDVARNGGILFTLKMD